MTLHLSGNVPWVPIALAIVGAAVLAAWAYRFAIPPLPALARRLLTVLRAAALVLLLLLLAQPVLERASAGSARLVVLLDRSLSMDLPVRPGGERRSAAAARAVSDLERAWRGRARIEVLPFAERLGADSTAVGTRAATGIGDALDALANSSTAEAAGGVAIVSDGASNAGGDPVDAARRLGLPVHTVRVGDAGVKDRAIADIEAPSAAQAGRAVPVRVHVTTTEERGTPMTVTLDDAGRTLATATIVAPGAGAEAVAELHATPVRPGLAVWTARVDSVAGELTTANDARAVAFPVSPGRLGVTIVTSGLNWDVTFLRRSLAADSSVALVTWVREKSGWRPLEPTARGAGAAPRLEGQAVLVVDGLAPAELGPAFDAQVAQFLDAGGGVLVLGGEPPGLARLHGGRLGRELAIEMSAGLPPRSAQPQPDPAARDLLAWDDDPARGDRAWGEAAPLADVMPLASAAGDRVLIHGAGGGAPLLTVRRAGRGQALLVNGTGFWRWSLSGHDELTAERGRRLWRGLIHWLAEPPQAEPLRVRPERWLTAAGEPVRLIATLQDDAFHPVAGATVEASIDGGSAMPRHATLVAGAPGSYTASVSDLPPGRYRVSATATRAGRSLGRATTELAVDRWSLEQSRALPDSVELAAIAAASGGRAGAATNVSAWARAAGARVTRGRTTSLRLWESPAVFALIVGALAIEWTWRRRRGLP